MKKIILLITIFFGLGISVGFCEIDALAHKVSADELLREGNVSGAIAEYEKALTLDPQSTALYFNLAVAYYSGENIPKAIRALECLLAINSEDVEAQYNLACLYLCRKDIEKAKRHFDLARGCCSQDPLFTPLIAQGIVFTKELEKLDPSARELAFLLLQKGLPTLSAVKP